MFASQMEGLGFFNRDTDVDGLVRSMRLLLKFDGEFYPSLALRALAAYLGEEPGITLDPTGVARIRLGSGQIPVDQQGRMTVNYYALENGVPVYSAADVIAGEIEPENLKDKLIFVGITETGVGDLVPTPVHGLFPGVAVHATGAANIIQGNFLHDDLNTVLWDVALIALIPLISVMFMAFIGRLWQMILAMAFFSAVLGFVFYYLVAYQAQLVSLIYPAAALIIAFTAFQVYYMLTSQRTTRFLTGAFSSYVPPDVVDKLLDTPDSLGLSGEDREVTVLFSDIRGFTGMSEKLEPRDLVDLLNEFFDEMTGIIQANNGTLDKFIGDAIMALFNAPLNVEGHPAHAARAALGMMDRLEALQPALRSQYGVEFKIGIGLHCGNAIVGNLGSTQRFDYTAVGDAVNLASRVEGASKYYGVSILHTQAVDQRLDDSFLSRQLDRIRVSGKMEYAEVFHLMNPLPGQRELAEQFRPAIDSYFGREFESAARRFETILSGFPGDKPAQIMLERCRNFIENPPAGDWDGVYQAESK
jgi:adenylate cyclase